LRPRRAAATVCAVAQRARSALRQKRAAALRSQGELAEAVHVSRQTISSLENAHSFPSVRLAIAIARALGTTVEELWG